MPLLKILNKFLGNKYEKDIKKIMPIVENINTEYNEISSLTNDELRKKTNDLKDKISDHIKEDTKEVNQLKSKAEEEIPNEEKETLYESIDDLEKNILNKIEDILNDILPTAFAIIKETAKRFRCWC